ncbi:MAG: alpha/beta hydrolase [Rivularia sp. (in: cyanobacteria)]
MDKLVGEKIHLRKGVNLQVAYNSGESPALVFLHGGLGNRFNWRSQYEFFLNQGREVLAYDLGGNGDSTAYSRYSLGRHQRDLTRLLKKFQIQSPVLCCHSYGVPLGLEWTRKHPVSGLILIAGGTHNLAPWWEIPLMKFFTWGGRYLYHLPLVQLITNKVSSSKAEKIGRFFAESPVPKTYHPYKALEIFWGYNFFHKKYKPNKFKFPVLVISGDEDPTFTESMGEGLAKLFPYGKHLHLPKAGHLLIAEYPEIVNGEILNLLSRL